MGNDDDDTRGRRRDCGLSWRSTAALCVSALLLRAPTPCSAAHVRVHVNQAHDDVDCELPDGGAVPATPSFSTQCPAICGASNVCVYFPGSSQALCSSAPQRPCYRGPTCAVQCLAAEPALDHTKLMVSFFTHRDAWTAIMDENDNAEMDSVPVNASVVTSIATLALGPRLTDISMTGNEPASNLANEVASDELLGANERVDLALPDRWLTQMANLSLLRIENIRLDRIHGDDVPTFPDLVSLSLDNTGLTGFAIPRAKLPKLKHLYLSNNPIKTLPENTLPDTLTLLGVGYAELTTVPADLASMTNLESLYLSGNPFQSLPSKSIPGNVKELLLDDCALTAIPPDVPTLSSLEKLDLSSNDLQGVNDFSTIPRDTVKLLFLQNCNLKEMPKGLTEITALEEVSLSGNMFETFDVSQLPQSLFVLEIDNCSLTEIPSGVEKLASLQWLNLVDNPIVELKPNTLPPSLLTLELGSDTLKTIQENTLPKSLTRFIVSFSDLASLPADFSQLTQLKNVTIAFCNLTSFPFSTNLQTIEHLLLQGNQLVSVTGRYPQAKSINVSHNRLNAFDFQDTTVIRELDLHGNNLSSLPPSLFKMTALDLLDLTKNPIANYRPSLEEFAFFNRIASLRMEQRQFAVDCAKPNILHGMTVCSGADTSTVIQNSKDNGKGKQKPVVLLLLNVFLVCLIVMVAAFAWFKRKVRIAQLKKLENMKRDGEVDSVWDDEDLLNNRLDAELVVKQTHISTGMFGHVWQGMYKDEVVAIKTLKDANPPREQIQQFADEIKLMAKLQHPRVVGFVGVTWTKELDLQLVTEFMENGDLRSYLSNAPSFDELWVASKPNIALDIAEALVYLHSLDPVLVHRDLKSKNILLDMDMHAKLSDFGVARSNIDDDTMTCCVGTVRWMAPEVLMGKHYDESADIYSFGMILSELDTHMLPYQDFAAEDNESMSDSAVASLVIAGSLTPTFKPTCPSEISTLALKCASHKPSDRPSAIMITFELRQYLKQHQDLRTTRNNGDDRNDATYLR